MISTEVNTVDTSTLLGNDHKSLPINFHMLFFISELVQKPLRWMLRSRGHLRRTQLLSSYQVLRGSMSFITAPFNMNPCLLTIDGNRRGNVCSFHHASYGVDWAWTWAHQWAGLHSYHTFSSNYYWLECDYQPKLSNTCWWARLTKWLPALLLL